MFKAINPDVLLTLSLERADGSQQPGQGFRIVRIASSDGDGRILVWIEANGHPDSRRIMPLCDAAAEYTVAVAPAEWKTLNPRGIVSSLAQRVLSAMFGFKRKRPQRYRMPLRDYLDGSVALLRRTCPVSAEKQTAVLAAWLLTVGGDGETGIRCDRWLDAARTWVRLEEVRGTASPATSVSEFFLQLSRLLHSDQQLWLPHPASGPYRAELGSPAIRAKPASFLAEVYRARARARNMSAAGGEAVDFRPYLECAFQNYWARLLDESPLLKEISGSTDGLQVEAQVIDGDRASADKPDHRHARVSYAEGRTSLELAFPFRIVLGTGGRPRRCTARVSIHCAQAGPPVRRPPRQFRRRLAAHLGDIRWALQEYFHQHGSKVSASERLAFRNSADFEKWLPSVHDDVAESRLQALAKCWEGNGSPEFQLDEDAKPIQVIARWLTCFPIDFPAAKTSRSLAKRRRSLSTPGATVQQDPQPQLAHRLSP
jgi:hypothetical protein